ncbi:MAG: metallophosphoesterase family protein [Gemmatimonadota bacterium]
MEKASRRAAIWLVAPLVAIAIVLTVISCFPRVRITPPPADAPAEELAIAGAAVLVGTGDITTCGGRNDDLTGALVDSILRADSAAGVRHAVFTTGDNTYPDGSARDFRECWGGSIWGDTSKLIMKNIRPAIGNHDLGPGRGEYYYDTFGARAGERFKGYYSYLLGEWKIIVLNSEITVSSRFPIAERNAQEEWLQKELESDSAKCTLAYMHRPLFSSGGHGQEVAVRRLWEIMYEKGVSVVLAGHDHHYERFAPQTPAGGLDTARGITQIVIGTGGAPLRGLRSPAVNSVSRIQGHFGILKLTLGAGEYRHAFISTSRVIWDRGGGKCR